MRSSVIADPAAMRGFRVSWLGGTREPCISENADNNTALDCRGHGKARTRYPVALAATKRETLDTATAIPARSGVLDDQR